MNSATKSLRKAVRLCEQNRDKSKKWRQRFHLMPPTGWLNDPNGLCKYNDEYHIFFQYSPYDIRPGLNCWGHYSTKDFVSYKYHEPALFTDCTFDCHGVYSGSAVVHNDKLRLYYTGNVKKLGDYDYINTGREHNTVVAELDENFFVNTKKVVLKNEDYPANDTLHVRDPKVWKENGQFYMILGARRQDDTGEVLVYTSPDGEEFLLINRITSEKRLGYMWECPDMFSIGKSRFLLMSPQGIRPDGFKYNNIYQSGYTEIFGTAEDCTISEFREIDHGFDFYAPQTFEDTDGRRIMIAWMGLSDIDGIYENPTEKYGWVHCLTLPRVLTAENGKLIQKPIEELKRLRKSMIKAHINGCGSIKGLSCCEIDFRITKNEEFDMTLGSDCRILFKDGIFSLKFGKSGYGRNERSIKLKKLEHMRIFIDKSSIEIFLNHGCATFTSRYYPEEETINLNINNGFCDIRLWELKKFKYSLAEEEFCKRS